MKLKILLCSIFTLVLASRLFSQNAFIKEIAPDFNGFKGVLLVQRSGNSGVDGKLEKRFEKSYKGEYEYIDEDDYKARQYKDLEKYRFVVKIIWIGFRNNSATYGIIMLDRVKDQQYQTGYLSGNTIPPYNDIARYAKTLEALRAK